MDSFVKEIGQKAVANGVVYVESNDGNLYAIFFPNTVSDANAGARFHGALLSRDRLSILRSIREYIKLCTACTILGFFPVLNTDTSTVQQYGVTSYPTVILLKNGAVVGTYVSPADAIAILAQISAG